jgi:hypothetical protein
MRRRLGLGYWSLSAYLKHRVKAAVNFIGEFEEALADEARRRQADGVVCGHIHHASDRLIGGIRYLNCGDWVESRTALAEDHDGRIHLIYWQEASGRMALENAQLEPARSLAAPQPLAAFAPLPDAAIIPPSPVAETARGGWTRPMETQSSEKGGVIG